MLNIWVSWRALLFVLNETKLVYDIYKRYFQLSFNIFYVHFRLPTLCVAYEHLFPTNNRGGRGWEGQLKDVSNLLWNLLGYWIKRDQLDVTCFFFHYLMLNMFRMLIHPSSGACDLFVELFHGLYCSGSSFSLNPDTTPPQPNHNVTQTRIEPEQYNPWNNSTNKSQDPEDGCINIRNMLSIK